MWKKMGDGEEKEMKIFLCMKTSPLADLDLENMRSEFEDRLETFIQRGSGFRLKEVEFLDWEVMQYEEIPYHVGHGKSPKLPPRLASKKAVVNVDNRGGSDCFK
jgi:hypothetical protein